MNKRKFLSLGWLAVPFLGVFFMITPSYAIVADNLNSATSQIRQVYMGPLGEAQTLNISSDNGGQITVGPGTTSSGFSTYFDSTQKAQVVTVDGMTQATSGVIYSSTGTTISTTTFSGLLSVSTITAASTNFNGTITLPANTLVAGKTFRYTVLGTLSTANVGGSNIVFAVKLGSTTIGSTGSVQYPAGLSSATFALNGILSIVSAGSFVNGASSATTSFLINVASGTNQSPTSPFVIGNSSGNVAQINTTQANDLNIVIGFVNTVTGNIFIPTSIVYERLN